MKKQKIQKIIVSLFLLVVFSSASCVFAQESQTTGSDKNSALTGSDDGGKEEIKKEEDKKEEVKKKEKEETKDGAEEKIQDKEAATESKNDNATGDVDAKDSSEKKDDTEKIEKGDEADKSDKGSELKDGESKKDASDSDENGKEADKMDKKSCDKKIKNLFEKADEYKSASVRSLLLFSQLSGQVEAFALRYEISKYDLKNLKSNLEKLKDKNKELLILQKKIAKLLKENEKFSCEGGISEKEVAEILGETQGMIKDFRLKSEEIRTFYKDKIRKDLLEVQDQFLKKQEISNEIKKRVEQVNIDKKGESKK